MKGIVEIGQCRKHGNKLALEELLAETLSFLNPSGECNKLYSL